MPITLASVRRPESPKPPRALVYGPSGVGKTSIAAAAPSPIFIQTEDGLGGLDVPSFGVLATFDEVLEAIESLRVEAHEFWTLAIDSLDHLEPLVVTKTCQDNKWKDFGDPGAQYGRGPAATLDQWRHLLRQLDRLRDERGMAIILIAHAHVRKFTSPEHEPYDRYEPKLADKASALIRETVDCVFFANYKSATSTTDSGFGKKIVRGIGAGNRVLYTEERPAFLAKHRTGYTYEPSIPLEWEAVAAGAPYYNQAATQAAQ